jgi:6-phosphofructokinase
MTRPKKRAVGILTGGRDCPGTNAVIRAAARTAIHCDWDVYGIEDGFEGLLRNKARQLSRADVRDIIARGGRVFGGTNRANPFEYPTKRRRSVIEVDRSTDLVRNFHQMGLAGLIVIGGGGTLFIADRLHKRGIPLVAVPKGLENDIPGTAQTVGFDTAVATAVDALEKLHGAAETHKHVVVAEVIGRDSGWVAIEAGIAGGVDVILVPEVPFSIESIVQSVRARERAGRNFSIVLVAEGASPRGPKPGAGHGIASWVADELTKALKSPTSVLALRQLQMGGAPSTSDRIFATRLGSGAMRLVNEGRFVNMVGWKPPSITPIPIHQAVGKSRVVPLDSDLLQCVRDLGVGLGD